ncbi:MAG TPA: diguanylate cyclase [Solirubrobacteraceae bacterium]|nr:diguanylate cyclase [Solirubrobacteraceae bacterium]
MSAPALEAGDGAMSAPALEDVRSADPVERLLEDSWQARGRRFSGRELAAETVASALFLACATPMALAALASHRIDWPLVAMLVTLYALASRMIKFPIGAGYVVPSYLVLVPMLLLLPPGIVPLLAASGLVLGTLGQVLASRVGPERVLFAIPDAWHALGPAAVLLIAGPLHGGLHEAAVYVVAFVAGCVIDLASATLREAAAMGIASRVQFRVIALVWLIDASIAPLGLLVAHAARRDPAEVLLMLPLNGVLLLLSRDRSARIEQALRRLDLVAHQRTRLQAAVQRLGEAFAAKLDLRALTEIVLRGSIEALDADAGQLTLSGPMDPRALEINRDERVAPALAAASDAAHARERPCQLERGGVWALALPFGFSSDAGRVRGALAVAREDRAFRDDEEAVMVGLVDRARQAAAEIFAHQVLREQALTDALTGLGNRRKLTADLEERLIDASPSRPLVLMMFDLDGFKSYNDTFGHLAGDAVLARLGAKLAAAVSRYGTAYRLGGDEFCTLVAVSSDELDTVVSAATAALQERGEKFAVGASYGAVLLPHEAINLDHALQIADQRMYTRKKGRPSLAGDQTRDVLLRIIHAKQPSLESHSGEVAELCLGVGRRLGMSAEQLDELARAAELHDVGKVGIPDAILQKPGRLNAKEWEFMHQHTVLGERILSAAPALRPVATIVRATHERWDGRGYPDRLAGEEIPLGSRIIAACDAYDAMTTDRGYRRAIGAEHAREELRREAGHQFDPGVTDALLAELGERRAAAAGAGGGRHERASAERGQASAEQDVIDYLREMLARHATASAL